MVFIEWHAVDAVMKQSETAGAVIVKHAQNTFYGGYAEYFNDLDGHGWEIAWNPSWSIEDRKKYDISRCQLTGYATLLYGASDPHVLCHQRLTVGSIEQPNFPGSRHE